MLIIIEGPDNTGKTTLARHLQEVFTLDYIHCSKPKTDNPFQEYLSMFSDLNVPTVIDRAHLGEYVYSKLWRDGCSITDKQFKLLDLEAMSRFEYTIIIHAQAPNEIILERCKNNNEKLLKPEQINRCSELFHEIFQKTDIPAINYLSHIDTPESIVELLCQMGLNIS